VTYKSRFEGGPGSNPEQLIGAAHATCFSMALASTLASAGFPAESIETDASVRLRPVDGTPTITKIELATRGRVPGVGAAEFRDFAESAKANCPVSVHWRASAKSPSRQLSLMPECLRLSRHSARHRNTGIYRKLSVRSRTELANHLNR
jgi:OsmC subfamily peroxiredoxin